MAALAAMYPLLHHLRALQKHCALCILAPAFCAQTICGYIAYNSAETQNGPSYAGSCTVTAIAKCCKQPCREKQRQSSPKVHIFGGQVAQQPVTAGAQGSPQTIVVSKGGQGGYQSPSPFGVRLGLLKNIPTSMDYGSSPLLGMSGRISRQRSGLSGVGLKQRYKGQDMSESYSDETTYDDSQGMAQSPIKARKGSYKGKLLNPAGGSKASWPSSYSQQAGGYGESMIAGQADQRYGETDQSYEEVPVQTRLPLQSRKKKAQHRGIEDVGSEQDDEADQAYEEALPPTPPPPPPPSPSRQKVSKKNYDSSGGQQYQLEETDQPSAGVLPPPHKKVQHRRAYMKGPDLT